MFWLDNPLELFNDTSVIPNKKSYPNTMNVLTRLMILITLVLHSLKIEWAFQFLFFSIVLIIILYYSKSATSLIEMFSPSKTLNTPLGNILYDSNNGAGNAEYRRIPIDPPLPSSVRNWGGYHPNMNIPQGSSLPDDYSDKIKWKREKEMRQQRETRESLENTMEQYERVTDTTPLRPLNGQVMLDHRKRGPMGSTGLFGNGTTMQDERKFEFSLEGMEGSFGMNEREWHSVGKFSKEAKNHPQPLNRGRGIAVEDIRREHVPSIEDYTWSSGNVPSAKTSYQRSIYQPEDDGRTGHYRSVSILGGPELTEDDIQKDNNQYYTTNSNPYDGLFSVGGEMEYRGLQTDTGNVIPDYRRKNVRYEDYVDSLGDIQVADELLFRDSMMEAVTNKLARTDYQYLMGPTRHA